ncbi:MAG: hypothetical protein IE886_03805 [Campylobacterales bacterium]|nr:hypothetical protein [Campylobacterales bacterium]
MPYLSILLTLLGVGLMVGLVSVVVIRMRNRRHLSSMRNEVELAKYAEKKPATKPKVMKGAQPDVGIRVLRSEYATTDAREEAPSTQSGAALEKAPGD